MKDYERLTRKNVADGKWDDYISECYTRLAELEDKIENGTLIELPCKVGDTVYEPVKLYNPNRKEVEWYELDTPSKPEFIYRIKKHTVEWLNEFITINLDNECVLRHGYFLTIEEAEQKLKELRGEV